MSTTKRLAVMAATGLLSVGIAVPTVSALTHGDDHPQRPATTVSTVHRDHDMTTAPGPATPTAPVVTVTPTPATHPAAPDVCGTTSTTCVHDDTTMVTHPEADDTQVHQSDTPPTTTHHDDEEHVTPTTMGHDDSDHDHEAGEHHG